VAVDVASAIQAVVQAGLVANVTYSTSASVAAGYVVSQSPAAGGTVGLNTVVNLVVSTGPAGAAGSVTVPNCVGLTSKAASDALAAANLSLDKYVFAVNAAAQGSVVSQTPASGGSVAPGTKVQLTLSAGPARVAPTMVVPVAS
jgi:beta-lactam-binding protein with PASTA domain